MLIDELKKAKEKGVAIGHFNFSDLTALRAIAHAARELNVPVIVGLSEGERGALGVTEGAALVKALREEYNQLIYLNADHTHSLASAIQAAKAGYDSIVYDRSELGFEENIAETARAVRELKAINPQIIIEGEIGNIGTGSEVHAEVPKNLGLSTTAEALRFIAETGVDVLAPAVGNMHGVLASMLTGKVQKRLHLDLIKEIADKTNFFLTLHGASETNDDDLRQAIKSGITIVHINTELRLAWHRGLDKSLAEKPDEIVPYKVMGPVEEEVKKVVQSRLELFSNP